MYDTSYLLARVLFSTTVKSRVSASALVSFVFISTVPANICTKEALPKTTGYNEYYLRSLGLTKLVTPDATSQSVEK